MWNISIKRDKISYPSSVNKNASIMFTPITLPIPYMIESGIMHIKISIKINKQQDKKMYCISKLNFF